MAVLFNGVPSHASSFVERDHVNFPTNVLTAPITIEGTPFGQAKAKISEPLKNTEWTRSITVHSFLERVLQSELDLAVVRSSVGDRGAARHVDSNLRTTPR